MKATELRIGNWVEIQGIQSKIILVDTEGCICENEYCEDFENNNITQNLQPIPLTEEWLERFGFDSVALGYEIDDRFITLRPEEDENGGFDLFIMIANIEQPMYITYIDYVHQLQNLYFALTGEELN